MPTPVLRGPGSARWNGSDQVNRILQTLERHDEYFEYLMRSQSRVQQYFDALQVRGEQATGATTVDIDRGAARDFVPGPPPPIVPIRRPPIDTARSGQSNADSQISNLCKWFEVGGCGPLPADEDENNWQPAEKDESTWQKQVQLNNSDFDGELMITPRTPRGSVQQMPAKQEGPIEPDDDNEFIVAPAAQTGQESSKMPAKSMSNKSLKRTISEVRTLEEKIERAVHGKDPEEELNYWEGIVFNKWFEVFFGIMILLNTVLMAIEMQYFGEVAGAEHKFEDAGSKPPPWIADALRVTDQIFLWVFTVELLAKMICLRLRFWKDSWNWLDVIIVAFGLFDLVVDFAVGLDPMMLRLLRLVKLVRFMKVFKMSDNVYVLKLILKSIMSTLPTLMWALVMLLMVQAVTGLFIGQLVHTFITDKGNPLDARKDVYKYYGSFAKVMFTMFEVTTVNYSRAARVLTDNVSESWVWFFVIYRCFVNIGLLQVVRAVFIQQTMKTAEYDKELLLLSRERQKKKLIKKLTDAFSVFDLKGAGTLSEQDFMSIYKIPKMQAWMAALDIDPRFPDGIFALLDVKGQGHIGLEQWLVAAEKLRGPSASIDLLHLAGITQRIEEKLNELLPASPNPKKDRKSVLSAGFDSVWH